VRPFCFAARQNARRRIVEGLAMTEKEKSWFGEFGRFGRSHLATQATVLIPVIVIAGLSAWSIGAKGQSVPPALATVQSTSLIDPAAKSAETDASPAPDAAAPASGAPPVAGLKISSQSWRRGGLGSNALFNFTLRNNNDYAVGDIEVACAFTRRDGSHLTDRKRVIPDAMVNMKSRKTFARVHIGFVNINANKAKCALVAASRI
jgi:hypothetical protein